MEVKDFNQSDQEQIYQTHLEALIDMAVYAQAPTVQSNPVGTFINAFSTGRNLFQQKQRQEMEMQRLQRAEERAVRQEERQANLWRMQMDSKELELDALGRQAEDDIARRNRASTDLPEALNQLELLGSQIDAMGVANEEDVVGFRSKIATMYAKAEAIKGRYAHVQGDDRWATQFDDAYYQVTNKLSQRAAPLEAVLPGAFNKFREEFASLKGITDLDEYATKAGDIERRYAYFASDPVRGQMFESMVDKMDENIKSMRENQLKARKEEQEVKGLEATNKKKELELKDAEKQKVLDRNNSIQNQRKLLQEKDKIRRLRNDINNAEFGVGGKGTIFEWLKQTAKLGERNAGSSIADEIVSGEWLENVSALKGALSDNEGARLAIAGLKRQDSKEVWLEKLNNLLDALETDRSLLQSQNLWYIDDKGRPLSLSDGTEQEEIDDSEVNDVLGGGEYTPPSEELDFSIFEDLDED